MDLYFNAFSTILMLQRIELTQFYGNSEIKRKSKGNNNIIVANKYFVSNKFPLTASTKSVRNFEYS